MTYYITGTVNLHGTVTLEGGAVIWMGVRLIDPAGWSVINCQTDPYRPVVMTSKNVITRLEMPLWGCSGTPGSLPIITSAWDIFKGGSPILNNIRICYVDLLAFTSKNSDSVLTIMENAQWVRYP